MWAKEKTRYASAVQLYVAVGLGAAFGFALQALTLDDKAALPVYELGKSSGIGFLVGAAAMLSELPNSFIKRRLDIAPVTVERVLWSVVFLFLAHQLITIIGYGLGMLATPR